MSILRSPTRSDLVERTCSQPNLSTDDHRSEYDDTLKVTFRNKRKQPDDNDHIRTEISEMRKQISQMMVMLTSLTTSQNEFVQTISEDIRSIKDQITSIKSTTDNLAVEQSTIKSDLITLRKDNVATEKKVEDLQHDVKLLKQDCEYPSTYSTSEVQESIIAEMNEREFRSKNIIISGIPEPESSNKMERINIDKNKVISVIKEIDTNFPEPEKILRLGKYNAKKTRPVKVCFKQQEIAKSILRNRNSVKTESIKIYSDQTPRQQKYLKNLKNELNRRLQGEEKNLIIKYFNGIPRIVEHMPKNGNLLH